MPPWRRSSRCWSYGHDGLGLRGLATVLRRVRDAAAQAAREKGLAGWRFDLSHPSYVPFLQFSARADLREKLWRAYNSRALGGSFDNSDICLKITDLRRRIAQLLGYADWAAYELEERMAKEIGAVMKPKKSSAKRVDVAQ